MTGLQTLLAHATKVLKTEKQPVRSEERDYTIPPEIEVPVLRETVLRDPLTIS